MPFNINRHMLNHSDTPETDNQLPRPRIELGTNRPRIVKRESSKLNYLYFYVLMKLFNDKINTYWKANITFLIYIHNGNQNSYILTNIITFL